MGGLVSYLKEPTQLLHDTAAECITAELYSDGSLEVSIDDTEIIMKAVVAGVTPQERLANARLSLESSLGKIGRRLPIIERG